MEAAKRYALDIADGRRPRLFSLTRSDKLESYAEAVAILEFARAQVGSHSQFLCVASTQTSSRLCRATRMGFMLHLPSSAAPDFVQFMRARRVHLRAQSSAGQP